MIVEIDDDEEAIKRRLRREARVGRFVDSVVGTAVFFFVAMICAFILGWIP